MKKKIGIYSIVNTTTGKMYIGSSVNINKRFAEHKKFLKENKHHSPYLQYSYNKHGKECFKFQILKLVTDISQLRKIEKEWILRLKTLDSNYGYNNSLPNENGEGIGLHSEVTKEILREKRYLKIKGVTKEDNPKAYEDWKNTIPKRKSNPKNKTRRIVVLLLDGTFVGEYKSNAYCSRQLNIPVNRIQEILTGKIYGKGKRRYSYKGYVFIYKDDYESGNFIIKHRRWDKKEG